LDYKHDDIKVLDVRKQGEWDTAHLGKAKHVCLSKIADNLEIFENDKNPVYIHCAGGYRSMIAASYLRQNGFKLIKNVLGGFNKIKDEEGLDILSEAVELK
jgi:rhodanese-related sulfurtransferase